jgi:hypothetical protein
LDKCEEILGKQRYIAGDRLTEADVRPGLVVRCLLGHRACSQAGLGSPFVFPRPLLLRATPYSRQAGLHPLQL